MRIYLVWILAVFVCAYSLKNWYRGALALIVYTAIYARPDMPQSVLGIQGLNPWNVMMLFVVLGWFFNHNYKNFEWCLPAAVKYLFPIYIFVIILAFIRLLLDQSNIDAFTFETNKVIDLTTKGIISEYFINSLKWLLPAAIVLDGARTREKQTEALFAVSVMYLLISLQIAKQIPPSSLLSGDYAEIALKVIQGGLGWSRVSAAYMMGGGAWLFFLLAYHSQNKLYKISAYAVFFLSCYALLITGGRAGYATWLLIGATIALLRYWRLIMVLPVIILMLTVYAPGAIQRTLEGIADEEGEVYAEQPNDEMMTSGRSIAWPIAIDKIKEKPYQGYGRLGMLNSGATLDVYIEMKLTPEDRGFPHPHNAYLQMILDNGIVLAFFVFALYLVVLKDGIKLFISGKTEFERLIGGAAFVLICSLMISGMGGQSFYPDRVTVGMFVLIALMYRIKWGVETDAGEEKEAQVKEERVVSKYYVGI